MSNVIDLVPHLPANPEDDPKYPSRQVAEELTQLIVERLMERGFHEEGMDPDRIEEADFTTLLTMIHRLIVGYVQLYYLDPDEVPDKDVEFFKGLLAIYNMGAIDAGYEAEEEEGCCC